MAKLSDFSTLAEAQAYTETTLRPVEERMVNERRVFSLLGMAAGEQLMSAIELSTSIPDRVKLWFKPSEQGIDIADPDALAILAGMVSAQVINQAQSDTLTGAAYVTSTPFQSSTEHDFQIAKGTCPLKPVTHTNGWVVIETTQDTPEHNPRLMVLNERLNKYQRINSFRGVSVAGKYESQVPPQYLNSSLFVDDAYGAI